MRTENKSSHTDSQPQDEENNAPAVEKASRKNSGVQCNLQVVTDGETSDASITAESVSSSPSSSYRLQRRAKSAPNHFRTQTAPPRLQKDRKSSRARRSAPKQQGSTGNISDVSSETSSLELAYNSRITCSLSGDAPGFYEYHRPVSVYRRPLRRPRSLPEAFSDSPKLNHPGLDPGQQEYLLHKASVYSVGNMKSLAQRRFRQMLDHQVETGFHTREECEKYYKYLMNARKRQYEADPSVWRAPPKLPVRPKHFHHRHRSQEEVEEARKVNTGYYRGQRSQGKGSRENLSDSMEKLSLFYSTDLKRTLSRKRQDERS